MSKIVNKSNKSINSYLAQKKKIYPSYTEIQYCMLKIYFLFIRPDYI